MITVPVYAAEEIIITGLVGDKVLIQIDSKNHVLPESERSPEGVKIIAIDHDRRRVTLDVNGEEQVHPVDISSRRGNKGHLAWLDGQMSAH